MIAPAGLGGAAKPSLLYNCYSGQKILQLTFGRVFEQDKESMNI